MNTYKATLSNGDTIKIDAQNSREATLEATKYVNRLYDVHVVEVSPVNAGKVIMTVDAYSNAKEAA